MRSFPPFGSKKLRAACLAALLLVTASLPLGTQPAAAQSLDFAASISGSSIGQGDGTIELRGGEPLNVEIDVTNPTGEAVVIGYVRLRGSVIGIDFVTTDTTVRVPLAPGEQQRFSVPMELFDLEDQATGLVRASLVLFDEDRNELASRNFTANVRGSIFSGLGLFSLVVFAFAAISVSFNVYLLMRQRLHKDRMMRGMQFAFSGLGVGLLIMLALSVLRITSAPPAGSLVGIAIAVLVGFGFGYLLPNETSQWFVWEREQAEQEWIDLEEDVRVAVDTATEDSRTTL